MLIVTGKNRKPNKKATVVLFGVRSVLESIQVEDLQIELTKSETGENIPHLILPPELKDKIEIRKIKLSS